LPQGWKEVGKLKNGKELETAKANKEIAEKRIYLLHSFG
jgi:hypothetical protein